MVAKQRLCGCYFCLNNPVSGLRHFIHKIVLRRWPPLSGCQSLCKRSRHLKKCATLATPGFDLSLSTRFTLVISWRPAVLDGGTRHDQSWECSPERASQKAGTTEFFFGVWLKNWAPMDNSWYSYAVNHHFFGEESWIVILQELLFLAKVYGVKRPGLAARVWIHWTDPSDLLVPSSRCLFNSCSTNYTTEKNGSWKWLYWSPTVGFFGQIYCRDGTIQSHGTQQQLWLDSGSTWSKTICWSRCWWSCLRVLNP